MNDELRKKIKSEVLIRYSPCDVKERIAFQEGAEAMHLLLKPEIERLERREITSSEVNRKLANYNYDRTLFIDDLEARLKIASEALEWYSDGLYPDDSSDVSLYNGLKESRQGKRAREALAAIRELDAKEKSDDRKET